MDLQFKRKSFKMSIVIIIGILISTTLSSGNALTFSPEETLFTYTRCMEDNFEEDYELVQKWKVWQLPFDDKSACYARCVLVAFGLFDEGSNSFMSGNILDQHNKYKSYSKQDDSEVERFAEAVKNLGSADGSGCVPVLVKYLPLLEQFREVQRHLYFGIQDIADKVYRADKKIKRKDETMFQFCERNNFEKGSPDLCTLRKTGITTKDEHLDCLFRGLRYLNKNGNINPKEIIRDLHLIGVTDKDAEVDKALRECPVDESKKATSYNDCLWKNEKLKEHMMPAFDYREVRSKSYSYFLIEPKPYNRDEVVAKVKQYDQDAGC